jgi:rhamnulokinase
MDEWEERGMAVSLNELVQECETLPPPDCLIDVDDPPLALPGDILGKINAQLQRADRPAFSPESRDIPLIANTIFHSIANRYAEVLGSIVAITGRKLKRLFIVGGGSKTESTTLGNFAIQMAARQGSWNDKTGVAVSAVAKWAEELAAPSFEEVGSRKAV